jgi:uncharacterized protein YbjQ (UPF0145 family)
MEPLPGGPPPDPWWAVPLGILIVLLPLLLPLSLLILGWLVGSHLEKRHYQSIREREGRTAHLPAVPTRSADATRTIADARLVIASVVISLDYFKRFLAALRKIFGGNVRAYESLMDRARREAVLRLKEQAVGADIVLNLRMETANIARARQGKGIGAVEVLASGTAVRYEPEPGA